MSQPSCRSCSSTGRGNDLAVEETSQNLAGPGSSLCLGSHRLLLIRINPLRLTVIQKLLEMIGRVRLYLRLLVVTVLDSDINQTTGTGDHPSMQENRCMHAAVCLLHAGQPKSNGNPIGLKGLCTMNTE